MTSPLLAACLLILADNPAPPSAPAPQPAPATAAPADMNVDDLLTRLEKADTDLRTLTASIVYDRSYFLQGDRHTRFGRLIFSSTPSANPGDPPRRSFRLDFDKFFVDGIERPQGDAWIFDGEWLVERREPDKMFTKRRIAVPGEPFDPFRVGTDNSMIPLPIGQRKGDILKQFAAEIAPTLQTLEAEPNFAESVKDAIQLHLKPLDTSDKQQFMDIRLWYAKGTLLPLMSRAVNRAGDVSIVQLVNTQLNTPNFSADQINTQNPPVEEGFTVQIEDRLPAEKIPVQEPTTP